MSILQKLTFRHLLLNRKRTAVTVIGIILSVAMVTAVSGMVVSTQDLLYRESVLTDGLWHVRYRDVPEETIPRITSEALFSEWELVQTEDGLELSLQFKRLHKGIFDESEAICQKYGIDMGSVRYNNNLLIAKGIVPGPYYRALYGFAGILLVLIAAGSILVISNAFTISSDQRSMQFGLLKSAGATRSQIRGMVLFEGVVLTFLSLPLGFLFGILAQWTALSIANSLLRPMVTVSISVLFRVVVSPMILLVSTCCALLTVLLAAWFPAQKASRVSAVEAIRQTKNIAVSPKHVRVSPLTGKLFGLEGMLASKTLRRNRGKYRTTILSLVVSIVLFIGVSSFADILTQATSMFYEDIGSNVILSMNGESANRHDELASQMSGWDGVQAYPSRHVTGYPELQDSAYSKEYRDYFPDQVPALRLFSIGDDAFQQLCRELRIADADISNPDTVAGILVNTTGTYIEQGRRIQFTPYSLRVGERFDATVNDVPIQLSIAGITSVIEPGIISRFSASSLNIIVSDEAVHSLWEQDEDDFLWLSVFAEDADSFEAQAIELLEQELPKHSWNVVNYEKYAANNRNIRFLVMIFVYGFIAMLSLIGITSVIATISTSISLRTREFAMLRSVGMSQSSIAKMLNYESLLYGIKALLIGIPIGTLVCWLLYLAMASIMDFPFSWPVTSILISIAATLLITFLTMTFARRKQRRINIVEALRDDVI